MTATSALSGAETSPGRNSLRAIDLQGPAGRLEALLNEGAPGSRFAGLVCHPYPPGGGTMHNKVDYHAARVLIDPEWNFQLPVLRFNFRGTGLSEGVHDGLAEFEDVLAALNWLHAEYHLPVVLVGFSFGAAMAIAACCTDARSMTGARIHALAAMSASPSLHHFTSLAPALRVSGATTSIHRSPAASFPSFFSAAITTSSLPAATYSMC